MKGLKKVCIILMTFSLVFSTLYSIGWAEGTWDLAEGTWDLNDPVTHEWSMVDLLIARPLGIAGGVLGAGIFLLSLPFSIPTGSVDEAAQTFVIKPFEFSCWREFPDDGM